MMFPRPCPFMTRASCSGARREHWSRRRHSDSLPPCGAPSQRHSGTRLQQQSIQPESLRSPVRFVSLRRPPAHQGEPEQRFGCKGGNAQWRTAIHRRVFSGLLYNYNLQSRVIHLLLLKRKNVILARSVCLQYRRAASCGKLPGQSRVASSRGW